MLDKPPRKKISNPDYLSQSNFSTLAQIVVSSITFDLKISPDWNLSNATWHVEYRFGIQLFKNLCPLFGPYLFPRRLGCSLTSAS